MSLKGTPKEVIALIKDKEGLNFSETEFLRKVSALCGYIPEETVEKVYDAVVRILSRDLTNFGACRLPHIGDFWIGYPSDKFESMRVYLPQVHSYPAIGLKNHFAAKAEANAMGPVGVAYRRSSKGL
jgi:hypothetical protein